MNQMNIKTAVVLLAIAISTFASAFPRATDSNPTPLDPAAIASFTPYARFASAAFCAPETTLAWTCGSRCTALPGFVPTASGGDGAAVQFWYVGYDPALDSVVVAHQGTNSSKPAAVWHDLDAILVHPNATLFPAASAGVKVHAGFSDAQAQTAATILGAVQSTLATHNTSVVTVVGHSLGAALAQLDAAFLRMQLPGTITVAFVGFGTPRVGNTAWAKLVDSILPGLARVNNKQDLVPILPGRFLGYAHPAGEVRILASGEWVSCALPDDPTRGCTNDQVRTILQGDTADHDGPYNGVEMGPCVD